MLINGQSHATVIYYNGGDQNSDFGTGVSLLELFNGASMQVDDKLFYNWSHDYDSIWGDAAAPDLAQIEVLDYFDARLSQTPIPEPATMLLFGIGFVGLAAFGRKRFFKK